MRIRSNTIQIGYDDHGAGQPVIFLHAFPLKRDMWEGQVKALLQEERYRLLSLDWRGFGDSELPGPISTMEQLADDVAGFMDALGMQQAVLCGLSMGGYAAFAFLRKYPERLSGLILADTRPGSDSEEARAQREKVAQLAETEGSGAIADLQVPRLISEYTRHHHPMVERRIREMIESANPAAIAAASRGMALRADTSDLLAGIPYPTLVIVGEEDILTPPHVAQEYASRITDAQFASIAQAGHLSNLEQPEAFLAVIRTFLKTYF